MATDRAHEDFTGPIRRLLIGILAVVLLALVILWRIDSPRVERLRMQIVDRFVPSFGWAMAPVRGVVSLASDYRSYQRLLEQNANLRRELQQMKSWREAALQLEQRNAKLLDLNNLKLDPKLTYISGEVLADSGSPFRQSVLINVGTRDGIVDGWPVMDGIGLVGRISGVGENTSRVVLLTDSNSRIPITIQPSGQHAVVSGDNTMRPPVMFVENDDAVRPGDRVVTSGDGGVFPADLLVGQLAMGADRRLRLRLSADYERLDFLRVLRATPTESIEDAGQLVLPERSMQGPPAPPGQEDAPQEAQSDG